VLEIEEVPLSPIGRTMAWTVITVFTVALLWAAFRTVRGKGCRFSLHALWHPDSVGGDTLPRCCVPGARGLAYAARVSLKRTRIQVDGTQVPLSLGMAVTVEIKTSTRRLLEYLLSLVLQAGQESV